MSATYKANRSLTLFKLCLFAMVAPSMSDQLGKCHAAVLTGAWEFNNSLGSLIPGSPPLTAINPVGTNTFETTLVFGDIRTVYRTDGSVTQEAGVSVSTVGLIAPSSFSVEMVIASTTNPSGNGWRSILNTNNFAGDGHGDNALYFDDLNRLNLFSNVDGGRHPGTTPVPLGTFAHVVLTTGGGAARAYLNGQLEVTVNTSEFNIPTSLNSSQILQFFRDDRGEYGNFRVASIRIYDGVLTSSEVADRAANPFSPIAAATPEPASFALWSLVSLAVAAFSRRRRGES